MIWVLIVIALLLALISYFLYKMTINHVEVEVHKVRLMNSIHHDLDRIGSIMRQMEGSA